MLAKVFKERRVYVKPVLGGWIVLQMTMFGSFVDDLMRFDPFVAIHNLIWQIRRRDSYEDKRR
jgi:hypothetical protein